MKIINDTLKSKDGRWDKQALTMFAFSMLTVFIGVGMVVSSYLLKMPENTTAENVFNTFAVLTGAMSGTNILNKLANKSKIESGGQ